MKNAFLSALALLSISLPAAHAQQDSGKDLGAIIKETEKVDMMGDNMGIVIWTPIEYWKYSLEANHDLTDAQSEKMLKVLDDYTIMMVIDAKKGGLEVFSYTPSDVIHKNSTLTLPSGEKLLPLKEEDLTPAAKNLFAMMKPMLGSMMGKLGENADFVLFSNKDKNGKKLLDSLATGKLVMNENGHTYTWRLPLGSLLPAKVCPTCGEKLIGNYLFCPYDGTKLK